MKYYLKLGFTLLIICLIASGILAWVNSITKDRIADIKRREAEAARNELIPGAAFDPVTIRLEADSLVYYEARDTASGELKGYTFTAAKTGYSSKIQTMAGVDPQFRLIAIKVIDQAETPGLGANCTQDFFRDGFKGLVGEELVVDKDGGKIKSLTGATITSRAIAQSLQEQLALVRRDVEARQVAALEAPAAGGGQ